MDGFLAYRLPEAAALPDGFVESSGDSLAPRAPTADEDYKDECQRVSTEGQNMRSDLSMTFKDTVKQQSSDSSLCKYTFCCSNVRQDVNSKLEEQKDECLYQLGENEMLRKKLEHLADCYALAEQQFAQEMKQKILELQLVDLKIQQRQEGSTQDQTQMQLYVEQVEEILATEKNLHLQLADDGDKLQQFQVALLKNNELFDSFKQEMEKMARSVKELKKENEFLKSRCEKSDITLVKLVEEVG
ncbi:putative alpha-taxilin [Cocos nucifera]|uniref:Putative alpha-taxilin n=1 Tax=Cocos nucifera TaxID=13894 RepID=A0A8K0NAT4_COCNU|nr:putative alpha-taxilin [Cocos nucifera]